MEDASLQKIFTTLLTPFLNKFTPEVQAQNEKIVHASIQLYNTIRKELLPTVILLKRNN